ncbi:cupin-like domain-containing protein [Roseateles sp.]|jgi:mannose-6-phosphate isomerase-like protein (cupin superfamily)|uniref:cupin-like domain-containing protein n=1 Tax=Roseateles sp. TaxID=1971397 RepID=UPI003953DEA1
MLERNDISAQALPVDLLQSTQPVLMRGLVKHWPLVQAAQQSDRAYCDYLRGFGSETRLGLWRAPPEANGRFFYSADFSGFNFQREISTFGALLDELLANQDNPQAPGLYLGSTELDGSFPGLRAQNDLHCLQPHDPLVSLWLGNRARVATHYDLPDNVACVVSGRRRFTIFPPDQVRNLYVGPLDNTPAGQPISLVDAAAPDFDRFPRYREALEHAQVAEMEPGDAIFIPSQWWHGVESLGRINTLVNFWWKQSPAYMDSPVSTLMMCLLTLRDLPPPQRDAWRALINHYVFEANDETAAHIPEHARGVLGPLTEDKARFLRSVLLNRLNR